MSRRVLVLALLAPLTTAALGCGIDEFEEVIVDEATIPAEQPAVPLFKPIFGPSLTTIDLRQSKTFDNNGVEPDDVDAIFIRSIRFDGSTGSGLAESDKLDKYLENVRFFVEAPGLPREMIAEKAILPATSTAELDVRTDLNLKPYAVAPSMSVSAEASVKSPRPAFNYRLTTTVTLFVDINLLGG